MDLSSSIFTERVEIGCIQMNGPSSPIYYVYKIVESLLLEQIKPAIYVILFMNGSKQKFAQIIRREFNPICTLCTPYISDSHVTFRNSRVRIINRAEIRNVLFDHYSVVIMAILVNELESYDQYISHIMRHGRMIIVVVVDTENNHVYSFVR